MNSVEDIFIKLGGTGAVAKIIGVNQSTASEMRRRGSVPVKYWPRLIEGGSALSLDEAALVRVHVAGQETAA